MPLHPLAGQAAPAELLIDPAKLVADYYSLRPDANLPEQSVSFGTSGHRGTSSQVTFNEDHILAISQAICEYRAGQGYTGPLYLGIDTHALSAPAQQSALEVLAANGVQVVVQAGGGATPTPVISHAILAYNRGRQDGLADGIVITPSHNPPADGGFKYNPPNGGPADTDVTGWVQNRANAILRAGSPSAGSPTLGNSAVRRLANPLSSSLVQQADLVTPYVADLEQVIDFAPIRAAGLKIGVHPLGGASLAYWQPIAERYGLNLHVVSSACDPRFSFMTVDHDGKIRMDCSSPYAMAALVALKDQYDIAFGNDPDADRHGIVTPSTGLMNPNHYLAVAIDYLLAHRPGWPATAAVGKTLVSSMLIDHVVAGRGRQLLEVPVGFKWFTPGLHNGTVCFGGEESAGASFLRRDGAAWCTDKDGLILGLLAAEITAVTGQDPGLHHRALTEKYGSSWYTRIDTPATPEQKAKLGKLDPATLAATTLAGDPITAKLTKAPGNNAGIGGLKVASARGWFAARPSGTENICKLYAESNVGADHLQQVLADAQAMLA